MGTAPFGDRTAAGWSLARDGGERHDPADVAGLGSSHADGVTGLRSRTSPGRPPALNETRREELKSIVLKGPDPERHRVVRWRRIDLCEEIAARWSVTVCEQTMGKWLRQLGMTRLQPRPYHPKKGLEAEVAFKNFAGLVKEALPASATAKPIEIWFQDEARVGQQGTLEYIWAPIGSRPRAVPDNRHELGLSVWRTLCVSRSWCRRHHACRQQRSHE